MENNLGGLWRGVNWEKRWKKHWRGLSADVNFDKTIPSRRY